MRLTVFIMAVSLAASSASADPLGGYVDSIQMLSGSSGGTTKDPDTGRLTIEKPGGLPSMSKNAPHTRGSAEIDFQTGPKSGGTPIGD